MATEIAGDALLYLDKERLIGENGEDVLKVADVVVGGYQGQFVAQGSPKELVLDLLLLEKTPYEAQVLVTYDTVWARYRLLIYYLLRQ